MTPLAARCRNVIGAHALCFGLGVFGCSGPAQSDFVITTPPPPIQGAYAFTLVNAALAMHCGTLNCHGNEARNMRIYGYYGIRINDKDRVNFTATTGPEDVATFDSLISIQPEILTQIVKSHGNGLGKWIVFSKGRGTEHHKGGSRMAQGDAMDTCLTSWVLSTSESVDGGPGSVNGGACAAAAKVVPPGSDWIPGQ